MRKLRLKEVKLLSQSDDGRKPGARVRCMFWVSTTCSSVGIAKKTKIK
jgi:hypothetical protein